jgi:hypothetical protein
MPPLPISLPLFLPLPATVGIVNSSASAATAAISTRERKRSENTKRAEILMLDGIDDGDDASTSSLPSPFFFLLSPFFFLLPFSTRARARALAVGGIAGPVVQPVSPQVRRSLG